MSASKRSVVERYNVVLDRLDQPQPLQLGELLGVLFSQVVGLGPVIRAVELPDVLVKRRRIAQPRRAVLGHRGPALVINAAIDHDLEVLHVVGFRGIPVAQHREHADSLQGRLLDAVDGEGGRQSGGLQ
jgi:hypothetical protein